MGPTRERLPSKRKQKEVLWSQNISISQPLTPDSSLSHSRSSSEAYGSTPTTSEVSSIDQLAAHLNQSLAPLSEPVESQPPCMEVRFTEHRGYSIFATRKINAGELVLAESPILRLVAADEISDEHKESALHDRIMRLPPALRKQFRSLHDTKKPNFTRNHSIWASNCYDLKRWSSDGGSCVGLTASRINHSCVANVTFSYGEEGEGTGSGGDGVMLFHAMKDIPKGKELLSNYQTAFRVSSVRQNEMQTHYGFTCDCQACKGEGFWADSDARRKEMIDLMAKAKRFEKLWVNKGTDRNPDSARHALERIASLLVKEGVSGNELVAVYKSLAKWSLRAGDDVSAQKWTQMEKAVCETCFGLNSRRVLQIETRPKEWWKG